MLTVGEPPRDLMRLQRAADERRRLFRWDVETIRALRERDGENTR